MPTPRAQLDAVVTPPGELLTVNAKGPKKANKERVDAELHPYRLITEASGNEYFCDVVTMIEADIQNNLRPAFHKIAAACGCQPGGMYAQKTGGAAIREKTPETVRVATRFPFGNAEDSLAARNGFV